MTLEQEGILKNYMVLAVEEKKIYAAQGYRIYVSEDEGVNWQIDGKIEDMEYGVIANFSRLAARLFRAEITSLIMLGDGSRIAIGKKAIFRAAPEEKIYRKVFSIPRGTRPLNLCRDKNDTLYFGEYLSNTEREAVSIYRSENKGESWEVCYSFPPHSIRHIHGIHYDKYEDKLWFTTGDLDGECMIGYSENGFQDIKIVKQGGQLYRAVNLMFFKDFILYGTDTETAKNYVCKLHRNGGEVEKMQELQGSVLSSSFSEKYAVLSTAVEPSEINHDPKAHIWFSDNGENWVEVFQAEKDRLSPHYFQFGRFKFPECAISQNKIYCTGHALKNMDGSTIILNINKGENN